MNGESGTKQIHSTSTWMPYFSMSSVYQVKSNCFSFILDPEWSVNLFKWNSYSPQRAQLYPEKRGWCGKLIAAKTFNFARGRCCCSIAWSRSSLTHSFSLARATCGHKFAHSAKVENTPKNSGGMLATWPTSPKPQNPLPTLYSCVFGVQDPPLGPLGPVSTSALSARR